MLDTIFLQILNMSFTASFVILFVLVVRLCLKKASKIFSYALWSAVLFRLICPFSFESVLSLLPIKSNSIPQNIIYMNKPQIDTGIPLINDSINYVLPTPTTTVTSINPIQVWFFIGRSIWIMGIIVLLFYSLLSLVKIQKQLKNAIHDYDNIFLSKNIESPFVMGLLHPKIYLPINLSKEEKEYILLHEQIHMKRFDHIVKILSFFVLCLHWFNPFVWVAFFLSGKDMEMSCDERVIKLLGSGVKKNYSTSLLALATGRKIIGGTPLAFGEGDIKGRIKNVLNYKKSAFWVMVVTVIAVLSVGIGLITNPKDRSLDLSFLNPDNLYAILMQRTDNIRIAEYNSSIYQYLDGKSIGGWINETSWKKKNVSSPYELSPTYVIENIQGEDVQSEIRLYESEPTLAMIWYNDNWQYYKIDKLAYKRFEAMIQPINYGDPFENQYTSVVITKYENGLDKEQVEIINKFDINRLEALLSTGETTKRDSVNDTPNVKSYIRMVFQTLERMHYCYVYERNGNYYMEKPYEGIWEISYDTFKEIMTMFTARDNDNESAAFEVENLLTTHFETIMKNPQTSSNPYDYIKANQAIFDEIVSYGDSTLVYCFNLFEKGGKTDLKGHLMMYACRAIQPEIENDIGYATGQEWYDVFKKRAKELKKSTDIEEIQKHYPSYYLLLNLLENGFNNTVNEIRLPDFSYSGNDELLKLIYATELSEYDGYRREGGFLIPAVHLHGSYEEGNKRKVFVTIYDDIYRLYGDKVKSVGGSIIPVAITYTKDSSGNYTVDEYLECKDGSEFIPSIKKFCTYPVSGKNIKGLADKILDHYSNYEDLIQLQRNNLIEHLNTYNQTGISLVNDYDNSVTLLN